MAKGERGPEMSKGERGPHNLHQAALLLELPSLPLERLLLPPYPLLLLSYSTEHTSVHEDKNMYGIIVHT